MKVKKFDKSLYNKCDPQAKLKIENFLRSTGCEVTHKPEDYKTDVEFFYKGKKRFMEIERKVGWDSNVFPFNTVVLSLRREKSFQVADWMAVLNNKMNKVLICKTNYILTSPKKELSNKYVKDGEFVFDVPIKFWKMYDL